MISSGNVTKSAISCGFGHISEKILNGKLHFLCSETNSCFITVTNKIDMDMEFKNQKVQECLKKTFSDHANQNDMFQAIF